MYFYLPQGAYCKFQVYIIKVEIKYFQETELKRIVFMYVYKILTLPKTT